MYECILKWVRAQNPPCPWDNSTLLVCEQPKIIKWLKKMDYERGCRDDSY
jgi:hypothetical protein